MKKLHIVSLIAVIFAASFSTVAAQEPGKYDDLKRYPRSEPIDLSEIAKKRRAERAAVAKAVSLGKQTIVGIPTPSLPKPSRISVSVNLGEVYYDFALRDAGSKVRLTADRSGKVMKIELVVGFETLGAIVKSDKGWVGDPIEKGDSFFDIDPESWEAFFIEHVTPVVFLRPSF